MYLKKEDDLIIIIEKEDIDIPSPLSVCSQILQIIEKEDFNKIVFDFNKVLEQDFTYVMVLVLEMLKDKIPQKIYVKNLNNHILIEKISHFNSNFPSQKINIL